MAPDKSSFTKLFAARYFYNSSCVHKHLFDSQYIGKLKLVCKYVKPNVLYSDVLKNSKLVNRSEQSTQCFSSCFNQKQNQDNAGRSRNTELYG